MSTIPKRPASLPANIVAGQTPGSIPAHKDAIDFGQKMYDVAVASGLITPGTVAGTGEILNLIGLIAQVAAAVKKDSVTGLISYNDLPPAGVISPLEVTGENTPNQKFGLNTVAMNAYILAVVDSNGGTGGGTVNTPPTFTNATVAGNGEVGTYFTAARTFTDAQNDLEGSSPIQWYNANADGTNPTMLNGKTGNQYGPLTEAEIGKKFYWKGSPAALTGAALGAEVTSAYSLVVKAATPPVSGAYAPINFERNRGNTAINANNADWTTLAPDGAAGAMGSQKLAAGVSGGFKMTLSRLALGVLVASASNDNNGYSNEPEHMAMWLNSNGHIINHTNEGNKYFGTFPNHLNIPPFTPSEELEVYILVDRDTNTFSGFWSEDAGVTLNPITTGPAPVGDIYVRAFGDAENYGIRNLMGHNTTAL